MSFSGQSVIDSASGEQTAGSAGREKRLLDAALPLLMRYGFDKTTVAEIAKGAAVSKGAVYLHFKSKEALFEALLRRELTEFNQAWLNQVEVDVEGGTLAGMFKNLLRALHGNPFVAAIFKNDVSVLGSYLRDPNGLFKRRRHHTRQEFIERMQAAGAIRTEVDPKVTAHIMNMLSWGLVSMDAFMDPQDIPSIDRLVEGIGDLLDRALTPPGGGNSDAGKAILRELLEAAMQRHAEQHR